MIREILMAKQKCFVRSAWEKAMVWHLEAHLGLDVKDNRGRKSR